MFDKKVSKSLLYENVVKKLLEMIDEGFVKPGDQFPTERELVENMGVSRNVLREAFHILEEKGIISSVQGKGRFLRTPPPQYAEKITSFDLQKYSLLEIYQVRMIIEMGTMDILAANATDADIQDLEATFYELKELFARNNDTTGEFRMHMAYAEKSHNFYLQYLLLETTDRVLFILQSDFLRITSMNIEHFIRDHEAIIGALKRRDALEAREKIRQHLLLASHEVDIFPLDK